jgi:hypothetical protein
MVWDLSVMKNLVPSSGEHVYFGQGHSHSVSVEARGEAHLDVLIQGQVQNLIRNVCLYIPGLITNLISVSKSANLGFHVDFKVKQHGSDVLMVRSWQRQELKAKALCMSCVHHCPAHTYNDPRIRADYSQSCQRIPQPIPHSQMALLRG